MPYTQRARGLDPIVLPGKTIRRSTTGNVVPREWETTCMQVVEYVYSWRTGASSASDVAPSDSSLYGIKNARKTGNLIEQLADRKRYYEEVMRAAFPAETGSGAQSTNRVSQTDNGHRFRKVNFLRVPSIVHSHTSLVNPTYTGSYAIIDAMMVKVMQVTTGVPGVINEGTGGIVYPFSTRVSGLSTATNRQATANSFFASTAPERAEAHILTTVVELLRGDVPSLLKNYRRALLDYQSKTRSLRYAGSEYLNVQFGWQPLIAEYANMIRVLIGIDRMVYSESNRRQRMWDGPSVFETFNEANVNLAHYPYVGSGEKFWTYTGELDGLHPVRVDTSAKLLRKEDYKFSARYSSLVKPNSRSNGFVEKAEETLRQLGLVDDPTLLWDLTPWSWLVDWASNIGNSITNANRLSPLSGRQSVDYAYFTTQFTESCEEDITRLIKVEDSRYVNDSTVVRPKSTYNTVSRDRSRATPFGFGTQLGSITTAQFAILVALGLARYR